MTALFSILIFPGFLFLGALGLAVEFIDRRLYARMQNRQGPPWFQPFADFVKLAAKKEIIPEQAEAGMFRLMPVFALTSVVAAIISIPLWSAYPLIAYQGDAIVVVYLLTIPTLTIFLGGWYSTSLFSMIGAMRALTQLFAYEVPMLVAILSPAVLANTWSLSGMASFYGAHPTYLLLNIPGFFVALVALQGKLERVPFDIPEAETEIVGGALTEYSGRLLALFRMAIDIEEVVGAALLAAVFLPFGLDLPAPLAFVIFIAKILFIVFLLALMRSVMARLRIEQMVVFCWKYVAPVALIQLLIDILASGAMKP